MKIALLGSIPKGDDVRIGWTDWKEEYKQVIREVLPDAQFVDGDAISDNSGPEMVVGHDLAMVKQADICVVDARSKIGAGTAQEIVFAKHLRKPVVIVIPKDTHHRKANVTFHGVMVKDWIHPFLHVSSDYVAESPEDAARWIAGFSANDGTSQIKGFSVFEQAIEHYEESMHGLAPHSDQE
jgi:hypothetical protein